MKISLIAALARNNAIGKDNQMLWHLSTDLKRFKRLTSGHSILMGRKTYESLGKPLPKRTNIVISQNIDFRADGVEVCHSLEEGLALAMELGESELFIIGGGNVYSQCLGIADKMYLTKVLVEPDADAFFPEFDELEWDVVFEEGHLADQHNEHPFIFLDLERRGSKNVR